MKAIIITLTGLFLFLFTGCQNASKTQEKTAEHETNQEEKHAHENEAEITEQQFKTAGIQMSTVKEIDLTTGIKVNGILRVPNEKRATINSIYPGTISKIYIKLGDYVKKGQTIATISNPEFISVQESYTTVNSQITFARQEVDRQKTLHEGNAGALKNLQNAQAQLKNLQAQKASLVKQLQLMGMNPAQISNGNLKNALAISSPINGYVTRLNSSIGNYVDASFSIAEVVDNQDLSVFLSVFEKDIANLQVGQMVHFTLANHNEKEFTAKVSVIGSSFEPDSKTVLVQAEVTGDKKHLIDGMNVVALLHNGSNKQLALPNEAFVNEENKDYIFVREGKGTTPYTFEKVQVQRGATDGNFTELIMIKPIEANAEIIIKGSFFVNAVLSGTEGHDH